MDLSAGCRSSIQLVSEGLKQASLDLPACPAQQQGCFETPCLPELLSKKLFWAVLLALPHSWPSLIGNDPESKFTSLA